MHGDGKSSRGIEMGKLVALGRERENDLTEGR